MTTIAYDGEVIAADSMVTGKYDVIVETNAKKLLKTTGGGIVSVAGAPSIGNEIVKWMNGEREAPEDAEGVVEYQVIYIDPAGKPFLFDGSTKWAYPLPKRFAVGSGSSFALALVDNGHSAIDAVKYAIRRDPFSGGPVTHIRYKNIVKAPSTIS